MIQFGAGSGRSECPRCGRSVAASTHFCPTCGAALAAYDGGAFGAPYSVGVAYGLWALGIAGVAGIHRFYTGRYITGVIWLVTWGLLGLGLLIDLFLIPGMVAERNREAARAGA